MRACSPLPLLSFVMLLAGCGGSGGGTATNGTSTGPAPSGQLPALVQSADLQVTSPAFAGEFFSGATATYAMTVSNFGPDTARDVSIQAVAGAGQTLSSIECVATGATCPASLGPAMAIPSLPNGGSLVFTVRASIGTTIIGPISASLSASAAADASLGNNVATTSATTRIPTSPHSQSFVALQSDHGDFIGLGRSYYYDRSNAPIEFIANGNLLTVRVTGDEHWTGYFMLPQTQTALTSGTYQNLKRYPLHDAAIGGLNWSGEGRACGEVSGSFTIDAVTFAAGTLATVDLSFVQHCDLRTTPLRGQLHWYVGDDTLAPGPVNPPPTGLWEPPLGATPATGSYVYLQSDSNSWVGLGGTFTYTQADATLILTLVGNGLTVSVIGYEKWNADFRPMNVLSMLEPGYYGSLHRFPFHNPTRGGLSWHGDGHICNTLDGWFIVDSVTYSTGSLTSIDLRFEQRCTDGPPWTGAIRGKIHWDSGDPTRPPVGPQYPPPAGLWSPPAGATPTTGNYIYLQSDVGDYIGGGRSYIYTQADSLLGLSTSGARLNVDVKGEETWFGGFQAMSALAQLMPGYYGNITEFPFHNPVIGGQSWRGEGRACNESSGWFVIDNISFANGALDAIDLRFERHCEFRVPALRGEIHWAQGDPTQPQVPQVPPPADLWSPLPGATPATGNYVYLSSTAGDFIGQGQTYLYTGADATVEMQLWAQNLTIFVRGAQPWVGQFVGTVVLPELVPGYYGNLQSTPGHNPVRGGLNWSGDGRGCDVTGWFVVDDIVRAEGNVESLDLRFEQSCLGQPPLRGKIHWNF